jgi:glycosyltransferase involved in cell wall biosynthesis
MADERLAYDAWHQSVSGCDALDTPWHRMVQEAIDVRRDLAGKRVLEIACGRGDFASWCAAVPTPPALLVAADFSGVAVRLARVAVKSSGRVAFFEADAQAIGLASDSFDTVICCETLEHLPHPRAALAELARVLRPGGRLFLTAPNYLGPMGAYRGYLRLTGRRFSEEGQPINRFLLAPRLRRWVRLAGIRTVRRDGTGHYLPWPRRAPILLGTRLRGLSMFGLHSLTVAVKARVERVAKRSTSVCFVVESGTDARMLEGLAARVALTVLAREVPGGRAISQPTGVAVHMASANRLAFAWRAFRSLMSEPYDAALVQGYGIAALASNVACRIKRKPCWMLVCSPAAEYYAARRGTRRRFSTLTLGGIHTLAWLNARIGRGYVVLSEYLSSVVSRYASGRQVRVIPVYGVDRLVFAPSGMDRTTLRRIRGLPASGAVVFNSSRVAPEKDTETLIEAFSRLVREGRDVYLLHRSGGHREFMKAAEAVGIAGRVIAADAVDPRHELPLDYNAADVCVQASREEGLGFSVLEALACGTPVVATAVGGLKETVQDGVTGWTAPPGDAAALADALRQAIDHPEDARRRTAAGAALVKVRFDSQRAFDQLADLLAQPMPGARRSPGLR